MKLHYKLFFLFSLFITYYCHAHTVVYSVEYGPMPYSPPSLQPIFTSEYKGLHNIYLVIDNWYYASRERADSISADAFIIPGGNTSDVPFYDGSLDSYVKLLKNPGRPAMGFCAGIQFLLMARGGICAHRSGEHGNISAHIFGWDEIFSGAPNPYTDRAAHTYSIADMPDTYQNYAATKYCWVTFVKHLTMPLYGSQLHIESMNNDNSAGPAILSNFQNIIMQRKFHGISEVVGLPGEPGKVRLIWWKAKTDEPVTYHIFCATDSAQIDYNSADYETQDLEFELSGLNHEQTYYFAVRAVGAAFADSNRAIYPLKPDGHREIVFQNGLPISGVIYDDCEATVIAEKFPNANFGRSGSIGAPALVWYNSGLVQFNSLNNYLSNKKIIGGKLTFLFAGGVDATTTSAEVADISIYRILKNWNEGVGKYPTEARTGEVTWNAALHNQLGWEVPGCLGSSDRSAEPIASYTVKGDGAGIEFDGTLPLPAELLQSWVDFSDSNHGLLYEKVDNYPSDDYFVFEDNDDEWFMNHPRLTVYYLDEETSVAEKTAEPNLPNTIALLSNYPNPFNSSTVISLEVNKAEHLKLAVFNINGQLIREIYNETVFAGQHKFGWNGVDKNGKPVASGIYLALAQTENSRKIQRMVVVR